MGLLKKLEPDCQTFQCDGRTFYIEDTLSFNRYEKLREYSLEFGFSATVPDVFNRLNSAWKLLNETKLGDAAVMLHNIMNGIQKIEKKSDVAFRVCALFVNEKEEDSTVWDEAIEKNKIECWSKEYDVTGFFLLASAKVPGWLSVYSNVIQGILKGAETENEKRII